MSVSDELVIAEPENVGPLNTNAAEEAGRFTTIAKGQPGWDWRGGVIGPLKAYVVVIAANDQIKRTLAVVLSRPTAIAVVAHIPNPDGPHNVEIGRGKIDADRGGLETVTVLAVM
jgi:hypothetical protein